MLKLFKTKIPKENVQEITEMESFTVTWEVLNGWSGKTDSYHKVIINENDAKEFEKQLKESAKFIKCWIRTNVYRN
jgi:hypothetical protein